METEHVYIKSKRRNMSKIPGPLFRSFNRVGRHWLYRQYPIHIERRKEKNFEFTIASYNVLADTLLHDHPHLYQGNHGNEPWVYDWNYRKLNLIEEIKCSGADILCLQEVQEEHYYNWFHPILREEGYTGLYKKRSGDKNDGCATFFKNNRFSMESYEFVDFYRPGCTFMDRNNVAILLFLQPHSINRFEKHSLICVGNTHLLFNKKRGDIKLAQLAHLFAEVHRLARKDSKYIPVLLCGDFNSVPFSPLYQFVSKGELRYEGLSSPSISGQSNNSKCTMANTFTDKIFPDRLALSNNCTWINDSKSTDDVQILNVETGCYENVTSKPNTPLSNNETSGHLRHDLVLNSSYLHYIVDGTREVTTCHSREAVTVDYIFYTPTNKLEDQLWLSGVLSLLTKNEVTRMGNLPNRYLSSDHLMLMASFVLP